MGEKKDRISRKVEGVEKMFLEACLCEVTINGREGNSLKALSWRNVVETLKIEHKFISDQKQMKNRYDYLKSKFGDFLKLKNKTGNVYNSTTNTFNLSKEGWELESKSNKHVDSMRRTPLPYPDLCTQLFEGATATTSTLPHPTQESSHYSLHDFDDIDCTQQETVGLSDELSAQSKKQKTTDMEKSQNESKEKGKDTRKMYRIQECLKSGKILPQLLRYLWKSMHLQI
ncbi:uncharacterized protein LOC128133705 [Lactuca sativa]|uniref:uncharacterized protein LOC128133705 n=1 Tax=Lactuca sativa TaxID=4236 RepID=UPI0022AFDFD6|nr:uncharacterized protein LOC128133705 [Lactuca sativa]